MTPASSEDPSQEVILESDEGVLYRQVHPKLFKNGEPTSVNFRPTERDAGKLSVDRSSIVAAEQAFVHYVERCGRESVGVWGVTVDEVRDCGRSAIADPIPEDNPEGEPANPAHAFVDFRDLTRRPECEAVAKILKRAAIARGRLHPPP